MPLSSFTAISLTMSFLSSGVFPAAPTPAETLECPQVHIDVDHINATTGTSCVLPKDQ